MKLSEVLVKNNYKDYLNGSEVEATAVLTDDKRIHPGEHVLVYRDSIVTAYDLPVPKEKQSRYIGVEGEVTQLGYRGTPENDGNVQLLKVKKI